MRARRRSLVLAVLLVGRAEAGVRYNVLCVKDQSGIIRPGAYNHAWLASDRRSRLVAFHFDHTFNESAVGFCDYDVAFAPPHPQPQPGNPAP